MRIELDEQEYQRQKAEAQREYRLYREAGGTDFWLDWLWEHFPDCAAGLVDRWHGRQLSSYTSINGVVAFCPVPLGRKKGARK